MATAWNKRHGESHTRLHNIWFSMIDRCRHEKRYAGRGIKVCDEWKDYIVFRDWALSHGYDNGLTIERIDVNGNYSPDNCTWIPFEQQARNRTTTFWVEYRGKKMSLAEACEIAGLPYKSVFLRIVRYGWDTDRALNTPINGKSDLHKKCDELGLNYHTVYNRIRMGWSEEDALRTEVVGIGANQYTYKNT